MDEKEEESRANGRERVRRVRSLRGFEFRTKLTNQLPMAQMPSLWDVATEEEAARKMARRRKARAGRC